jgi:hypothetical protein
MFLLKTIVTLNKFLYCSDYIIILLRLVFVRYVYFLSVHSVVRSFLIKSKYCSFLLPNNFVGVFFINIGTFSIYLTL